LQGGVSRIVAKGNAKSGSELKGPGGESDQNALWKLKPFRKASVNHNAMCAKKRRTPSERGKLLRLRESARNRMYDAGENNISMNAKC